jgi:hypothetical protein
MSNQNDSDRERGILTEADIKYLRGELDKDLSDGAEFNTRRRIVNRTREALLDFTILLNHLNDRDLEKVFSLSGGVDDRHPMLDGVQDAIGLFYLGLLDNPDPFDFTTRLQGGVNRARERKYGRRHRRFVDVEFEVEELPVTVGAEVRERLRNGEYDRLSEGELRRVVSDMAKYTDDSLAEAIQEGKRERMTEKIAKKGPPVGLSFPYADEWEDMDPEEREEILDEWDGPIESDEDDES